MTTAEEVEATGYGLVGAFGSGGRTWSEDEEFEVGDYPHKDMGGGFMFGGRGAAVGVSGGVACL